jgi:hypothetical protein
MLKFCFAKKRVISEVKPARVCSKFIVIDYCQFGICLRNNLYQHFRQNPKGSSLYTVFAGPPFFVRNLIRISALGLFRFCLEELN